MAGTELGDEFRGVLCGVDGEGFGDDEESLCEFANGELFPGALDGFVSKEERREGK